MRRFTRHNRKDRTVFGGPSLTSGYSRPLRREMNYAASYLIDSHPTKLKASPFMGYNGQFRKGGCLCSKAMTAGN